MFEKTLLIFLCTIPIFVNMRPISSEARNKIAETCLKQTGLDRKIVAKVIETQIFPENNQVYKEFLSCSYRLQGFQKNAGHEIVYSELEKFIENFYDRDETKLVVGGCKNLGDTPPEAAYQTAKCLVEKLSEVELKRSMVDKNEV